MSDTISLTNPTLELSLPTTDFTAEVTPGRIKNFKSSGLLTRNDGFYNCPLDMLRVHPDLNVRIHTPEYEARVRALADAIKLGGFRPDKPISVIIDSAIFGNDMPIITDGHTRFAAADLAVKEGADVPHVPIFILPRGTSMDDVLAGLVVANNGTPLDPMGLAIVVKRFQNRGYDDATIAQRLSLYPAKIDFLARLAAAPKALQLMVASNQVAATTVVSLIQRIGAEAAKAELLQQLANAQASGKGKVLPKQLPGVKFNNAIRKSSSRLYDAAQTVRQDPAYVHLNPSTRKALDSLLSELDTFRDAAPNGESHAAQETGAHG